MKVTTVADDLGFTEGPVALPDGRVALTSINHGCVYVVAPDGTHERIDTGGGANGLTVGPTGDLYVAQNGGAWGGSGPAPTICRSARVIVSLCGCWWSKTSAGWPLRCTAA